MPESQEETKTPVIPQSKKVFDLAIELFDFSCTLGGIPYAVRKGSNIAKIFKGRADALRATLSKEYYQKYNLPAGNGALADAIATLEGIALEGERKDLPLRVANVDKDIWLDLGRQDGLCVKINRDGWTLEKSSFAWYRTELTGLLPTPVKDGKLSDLWKITNVAKDDRSLVVAWLISSFFVKKPHPILLLQGLQGTAKSTTGRALVSLIDPCGTLGLRSTPHDAEQWITALTGSWVAGFDNLSHIPTWLADAMCRAVTGDGQVKRRLYTDDGLFVTAFRRVLLLTSIDVGAIRGDLADRLLLIKLDKINKNNRKQEEKLEKLFQEEKPKILGALLDLLVQVLRVIDSIELTEATRMADFNLVLTAIDKVTGSQSLKRYIKQAEELAEEVVEGDEVAHSLSDLINQLPEQQWSGTATELLALLRPVNASRYFPTTPKVLSGRLRQSEVALESAGIKIEHNKKNHERVLNIIKVSPEKN